MFMRVYFYFYVWSHELKNVGVGIIWLPSAFLNICSVWKNFMFDYICKHVLGTSLPAAYDLTKLMLY
jgi:hypothetical protein